jgi:hypothetical protein
MKEGVLGKINVKCGATAFKIANQAPGRCGRRWKGEEGCSFFKLGGKMAFLVTN